MVEIDGMSVLMITSRDKIVGIEGMSDVTRL